MSLPQQYAQVEITEIGQFWAWLLDNWSSDDSILLITWKASVPANYVSRDDVLDALIAYGWIDGRRYVVDANRTAQLVSKRKVQHWAQSYKDRAGKLIEQGRMMPPGFQSIADGKANGLWDFMADVDALIDPEDLALGLGAHQAQWADMALSYRRNVLRWIKLAKTEATRAKRVKAAVQATQAGQKIPQM